MPTRDAETSHSSPSVSALNSFPDRSPLSNELAPVGAYQAFINRRWEINEKRKLCDLESKSERCPTDITWEQHYESIAVQRRALKDAQAAARAKAAEQQRRPTKPGRIASLLQQASPSRQPYELPAESRASSIDALGAVQPEAEALAQHRRRWLSKLCPPVLHEESTSEKALSLLPKPLWELYLYLTQEEAASNRLMLPACIRGTVTAEIGRGPLPSSFFYMGPSISGQIIKEVDEIRDCNQELAKLKELVTEAANCDKYGTSDQGWNDNMRAPLLDHIFGSVYTAKFKCGRHENVDLLRDFDPVPEELLPEEPGSMSGRVSLTINIFDEYGLERDVRKKLVSSGNVEQFANHIAMGLDQNGHIKWNDPIGSIIETPARSSDVAMVNSWGVDLGVHAAALHNRLSTFLDAKYSKDRTARYEKDR